MFFYEIFLKPMINYVLNDTTRYITNIQNKIGREILAQCVVLENWVVKTGISLADINDEIGTLVLFFF